MTQDQLDLIPERLLRGRDATELIAWLAVRGWRLSLVELEDERRRRGIRKAA